MTFSITSLVIWSFFVAAVMVATWDQMALDQMFIIWIVVAIIIFVVGLLTSGEQNQESGS